MITLAPWLSVPDAAVALIYDKAGFGAVELERARQAAALNRLIQSQPSGPHAAPSA